MDLFISCVSTEFKSYRLRLANQLGVLKDHPYDIKVQEDFQRGVLHPSGQARGLYRPDHIQQSRKTMEMDRGFALAHNQLADS